MASPASVLGFLLLIVWSSSPPAAGTAGAEVQDNPPVSLAFLHPPITYDGSGVCAGQRCRAVHGALQYLRGKRISFVGDSITGQTAALLRSEISAAGVEVTTLPVAHALIDCYRRNRRASGTLQLAVMAETAGPVARSD